MLNPKKLVYDLLKCLYWSLPPALRQTLQGPRHQLVRWIKSGKIGRFMHTREGDISWKAFKTQVLSHRNEYKGIFIQESTITWNASLYQRPQHIACAFGSLGYLVLYKISRSYEDYAPGVRNVAPNVWITTYDDLDNIEGAVYSFYSTDFLVTPKTISERKKNQRIVYEYIDHIDPQISGDAENVRRLLILKEFAFSGGADYIVTSALKLKEEVVQAVDHDKVILAQNGVDTRHYRNPIHQTTALPNKLETFRTKYANIVGYFGALAPWLWYPIISELTALRPDLGFVFIGPDYYGGANKLPKAENILYLGTVDYKILPAYAQQFDVCFIPFAPGEIARTTSPLKLFEYFALEKPVVVTSEMQECIVFKEVFSGNSANSLSQAIDAAIHIKNDVEFKARLAQLADANDWIERARTMELIFNNLEEKQ